MIDNTQWPASDAGIPLRTKFRLWIAAIVADEAKADEQRRVDAAPEAGGEPGQEHPPPAPTGLDPSTGYDPLPPP